MKKPNLLLISFVSAILVTFIISNISYYSFTQSYIPAKPYDLVSGMPFITSRTETQDIRVLKKTYVANPVIPVFLNFLFFFLTVSSFFILINRKKYYRLLVPVYLLSLVLTVLDLETGYTCLNGFPVGVRAVCADVINPNQPFWIYGLINYLFWLLSASLGVVLISFSYKSNLKIIRFLPAPAVLTLLSWAYQEGCSGLICLFPSGRGFPFAFTGLSRYRFFFWDYLFWFMVWAGGMYINKKFKKKKNIKNFSQ